MANRVVLLGPALAEDATDAPGLEMNAQLASALRDGGTVTVRLSQLSGQLADATVLVLADRYVEQHGGDIEKAWARVVEFVGLLHGVKAVRLKLPLPMWNGGLRRWTDNPTRLVPEPGDLARVLEPVKLGSRKATIPADQNGIIDSVSDDEQTIVFKWRDAEGTHIIALAAADVEVVP